MAKLVGTGVELRLADADAFIVEWRADDPLEAQQLSRAVEMGKAVIVERRVFAELEDDGKMERWDQPTGTGEFSLGDDATTALLDLAYEERDQLGDLLGDLRIAGYDVARWDFYAAPFRIELADDLRHLLNV